MELIRNIKFKKIRNTFQKKLKKDIKLIKEWNKITIFVDTISNNVSISKGEVWPINNKLYSIYLQKANNNIQKQIDIAEKNLMKDKEVIKQIETNEEGNSYIIIKDQFRQPPYRPANQLC